MVTAACVGCTVYAPVVSQRHTPVHRSKNILTTVPQAFVVLMLHSQHIVFMHSHHMAHLDISIRNLLTDYRSHYAYIDFETTRRFDGIPHPLIDTCRGTDPPPEAERGEKHGISESIRTVSCTREIDSLKSHSEGDEATLIGAGWGRERARKSSGKPRQDPTSSRIPRLLEKGQLERGRAGVYL